MVEVCGYCKDTHGRHFLGCPYVDKASDTVGQVAKDVRAWDKALAPLINYEKEQAEKIDKWRMEHGLQPRVDGVIQADGPVREGDVLVVGEGGYSAAKQNPKDIAGSKKPAYDLLAMPHALNLMAEVMKHGADKYGPFNWRNIPITSSAYYAAIGRHWAAMASGEWLDPDSGQPHAAHIMATCAIMLDADAHRTLKK